MNFALDPALVDALKRTSAIRDESMSAVVREALRAALASEPIKIGAA